MPFPYRSPLKEWMVDVLETREKNPNISLVKMPYAVLSSGAIVVKHSPTESKENRIEVLKAIISGSVSGALQQYNGCIIANNINIKDNYQTGETLVGYTFDGNPIKVENEKNRRVSTPIIESIEIDTDGANNTLKTARVSVTCFTLKQLEMFELFFLKPGMNLLLEFGDSSLLRTKPTILNTKQSSFATINNANGIPTATQKYTKPEECLIVNNKTYDEFVKNFSKYYYPTLDGVLDYLNRLERASGTYDYVAGKVTDFSYTIEGNGVYKINLTISQGNQFTLAIPKGTGTSADKTGTAAQAGLDIFEQTKLQICADLQFEQYKLDRLLKGLADGGRNEFFNWGKLNEKQEDESVSKNAYVSFRFIIKVLMNYVAEGTTGFELNIPKCKVNEVELECVPLLSHKYMLSSKEVIIFPGRLPIIDVIGKTDEIGIIENKFEEFNINKYSFNITDELKIPFINNATKKIEFKLIKPPSGGWVYGNALNCFISYSELVQIWRKSYTRLDFLEQVLVLINENGYGCFDLRYSSPEDGMAATIIDYKMVNSSDSAERDKTQNIYRFKPTTIYSIVKDFQFNVELSNLVAGQTIFNAQKFISDAINAKPSTNASQSFDAALQIKVYESVDYSMYTTYDGYYSINKIDAEAILKTKDKLKTQVDNNLIQTDQKPDETVTSAESLSKIIASKSINFKQNDKSKTITRLIYKNEQLIIKAIGNLLNNPGVNKKSTLTPFQVSITIDGLSGFSSGEYFKIDGIPETYNRDGVFQITNIKHSISPDGWYTVLEAGWLIIN